MKRSGSTPLARKVALAVPRKLQKTSTKALVRAVASTSTLGLPTNSPGVTATVAPAAGMPFQATRYSSRRAWGTGSAAWAAETHGSTARQAAALRSAVRSGGRLVAFGLLHLGG